MTAPTPGPGRDRQAQRGCGMTRRDRRCCCGCGRPAVHILTRHGDRAIDLAFADECKDKYDAAEEHFRRTCDVCKAGTSVAVGEAHR